MQNVTESVPGLPDMKVSVRQSFGIDSDMEVPAYSAPDEHVPDPDPDYLVGDCNRHICHRAGCID